MTKISKLIFSWLFLFPIHSEAQQLKKGTFFYSGGFVGETLTIRSNNRFEYSKWSCTGGSKGFGHYILKDKNLFLLFEDKKNEIFIKPIIAHEPLKGSATELYFTFWDVEKKESIDEGVIICLKNRDSIRLLGGTVTSSHKTHFQLRNSDLPVKINISCFAYKNIDLDIDSSGKYSIDCPLYMSFFSPYKKGDSLHFSLNLHNRKQIQIKEKESINRYIVFFRKKKWWQYLFSSKKKPRNDVTIVITNEGI